MIDRRTVDAPQMANVVMVQRLEYDARCDTVADTGLDYVAGSKMAGQIPYRTHKVGVTVIPAEEAFGAGPDAFGFQLFDGLRPR